MNKHSFFTTAIPAIAFATMAHFSAPTLHAQEIAFSGSLTTQAGIGLPNAHKQKGDFLLGQTIFDGSIKAFYDDAMIYVNGQLIHDAIGSQSSNGMSGFIDEDGSFALRLKEAYIDWKNGIFALRIGRQIVSWGKADDIQIADVVSPFDESRVVASDYNESKLGIDAVRLSLLTDKAQVDAYYIPFFTPSILPIAAKNPLRAHSFPDQMDGIQFFCPFFYDDFELPHKDINNSEYALRASFYTSVADLSLYGFYGWDDTPFIKYSPYFYESPESAEDVGMIDVTGKYKRMSMIGADAAIPAGDFVFRLETAFFPMRHIQTTADYQIEQFFYEEKVTSSKKKHQLISLVGFDWTLSGGWTITAQYISDVVFKYRKYLDRKQYEHQATLSIEKTLLNETLTISASGALDLCNYSTASELEFDYKLTDAITLSLIGDLYLKGPDGKDGMYGQYRDFSSVTFKGKVSF